jgi:hypothetical protein
MDLEAKKTYHQQCRIIRPKGVTTTEMSELISRLARTKMNATDENEMGIAARFSVHSK